MKKKIPQDLQVWIEARRRHKLSHAQVQMARELGLNPRKFGKLDNHKQEPWKAPLPQFIEELYLKRFGKAAPDEVLSIEERAARLAEKRAAGKASRKAKRQVEEPVSKSAKDKQPSGRPAALRLIRHAQSEANAGAATSDNASIGLTRMGCIQAERLAAAWPRRPDRVVVSPYRRARLTAAPTLARFPGLSADERPVQEFTYLAADRCRDTTAEERAPLVEDYWRRMDPAWINGPGAESFAAFAARVRSFLAEAAAWPGLTLVFTHEQFIRAAAWAMLLGGFEGTVEDMVRFHGLRSALPVSNGAYLPVELGAEGAWLGAVVTDHLREPEGCPF